MNLQPPDDEDPRDDEDLLLEGEGFRRCPWCGEWVTEDTATPRPPQHCYHETSNP